MPDKQRFKPDILQHRGWKSACCIAQMWNQKEWKYHRKFSQDLIGGALSRIGAYNDLDNKQQKIALIDEVNHLELSEMY